MAARVDPAAFFFFFFFWWAVFKYKPTLDRIQKNKKEKKFRADNILQYKIGEVITVESSFFFFLSFFISLRQGCTSGSHTGPVPTQWSEPTWEIASSYHILYLLAAILAHWKIAIPLSNIIVCAKSAKITLSISDHSAGVRPLNFINIQGRAWPASQLAATWTKGACTRAQASLSQNPRLPLVM